MHAIYGGGHNKAQLVGMTIAGWLVVAAAPSNARGAAHWVVRGACGHEQLVRTGHLRELERRKQKLRCQTCGKPANYKDEVGEVVNGWTVVARLPNGPRSATRWRVQCALGHERSIRQSQIRHEPIGPCRRCALSSPRAGGTSSRGSRPGPRS